MAMSSWDVMTRANNLARQEQEEFARIITQETISKAMIVRDRRIYAFKREFFLTVAAREASGMAVKEANARADEVIAILYPDVTPENAAEYLNRA